MIMTVTDTIKLQKYGDKMRGGNHFKSIFAVTKFLITTGIHKEKYQGQNFKSRIIDLSINVTSGCSDWPKLPNNVYATGGLVSNTPMICGGWNFDASHASDECHILDGKKSTLKNFTMKLKIYRAASIVLNEKTLWITGGKVDLEVRTLNVDEGARFLE